MTTGYEAGFYRDIGELVRVMRDHNDRLIELTQAVEGVGGQISELVELRRTIDEEDPIQRIAHVLEKVSEDNSEGGTPALHRIAVRLGTPVPAFEREALLRGRDPGEVHVVGTWHVRANDTGEAVSKDFRTLQHAESACAARNTPDAGGRYGVYDHEGRRVE